MFSGEQQKNVDFAYKTAIKILHLDAAQIVILMYDIVCQYIIYFFERLRGHLPPGFTIDQAIDLFHVHCHKDKCFFRYASTFIPNIGIVAGQILESLWSSLNTISPTVRTATLPHRAEVLDDHACDSNHKKMLSMPETLHARYFDAVASVTVADSYFVEITSSVEPRFIAQWEADIKSAEENRRNDISVMDIYAAKLPNTGEDAPSVSESDRSLTSLEKWMSFALHVEEIQQVKSFP